MGEIEELRLPETNYIQTNEVLKKEIIDNRSRLRPKIEIILIFGQQIVSF